MMDLGEVLSVLSLRANEADTASVWPEASWQALRDGGVLGWIVPREHGGQELEGRALLEGYERIASACLTTAFILSQRDAACRRLRDGDNAALAAELLPKLASGSIFATVGISQLTTSRQHGKPALVVEERGDHFVLDGTMPWVTGAPVADFFITGASRPDRMQILLALPARTEGIEVVEPLSLMAVQGSLTCEVHCRNVAVDRRWLIAGPAERVLVTGKGGAGGLETSCLALGLTSAALDYLGQEAASRPEWKPAFEHLDQSHRTLRKQMWDLAEGAGSAEILTSLRAEANALVLRSTQVALAAGKGTGFLRHHPAQRWARQALFFLVWSCPRPALEGTLAHLVPETDHCDG